MIEPYNAVGLIPTFWGIRTRADMQKNIEHIRSLTKAAFWLSNLDIPVRLLAIPEGALQGFQRRSPGRRSHRVCPDLRD